ncbi:exopolysaccharide production repressor protein [Rhizobium sp. XQZ8]|jgi:exopolysaccharide production repressor protein|uniref:exopolysaccharide production repressor protein n=1 Tax=Rhizobium populisoli TaxID=2859785 RepID=UPI001CA505A0|nr:exopolysaccharide production repressor protein [Rhizobium populisoli]MBW6425258.1 exopolysaccharide production repressor protein [Rhizobium populisoli]
MYAPRVLISMTMVLLVFAVSAYFISGSVYTALIHTLICAVILQVGYFVGVLYLVSREKKLREESLPPETAAAKKDNRREGLRADTAPNVPAGDT